MSDSSFTFRGQRPNERVENVIRRHPIVFCWPLLKATFALAIIAVVFVYFSLGTFFYLVALVGGLYIFAEVFKIIFIYSNSFCLITNQRLINIDQKGFFNRDISETDFFKIQDVTNKTSGFFGTTLNYGIITVQTAGTQNQLVIKTIPDPYQIQQEITRNIRR
ncbi:MAG: PH domain-containing protein [Candidatus Berkelbacteria bacterium]|nr:PH domain-containing protein [Candidatus Berkelbacteria bacterium]